jgi:dolichol kinase
MSNTYHLAKSVAGVLATFGISTAFFFAIIGVFGMWTAIAALAIATEAACLIGRRRQTEECPR